MHARMHGRARTAWDQRLVVWEGMDRAGKLAWRSKVGQTDERVRQLPFGPASPPWVAGLTL
jgi:hypothetical protein